MSYIDDPDAWTPEMAEEAWADFEDMTIKEDDPDGNAYMDEIMPKEIAERKADEDS